MTNIKIVEKSDDVSWEKVTEVIHDAYKANEKKNLLFAALKSTPEENSQKILDGKCFLALDGKEVAGLVFLRFPSYPYLIKKMEKGNGIVINYMVWLLILLLEKNIKSKVLGKNCY